MRYAYIPIVLIAAMALGVPPEPKRASAAGHVAAAAGAPPLAVITGKETADTSELVTFSSSESVGSHQKWLLMPAGKGQFVPDPNDSRALFVAKRPGRYTLLLVTSNGPIDIAVKEIQIGDVEPSQPDDPIAPAPDEPVPPKPKPSDALSVLRQDILTAAKTHAGPRRREILQGLADNFAGVAGAINAGTIKDRTLAKRELYDRNMETYGDDRAAWWPFIEKQSDAIWKADQDRATIGELAEMFRAVAAGLTDALN